ncbi:MAG: hypothetical protein ABR611_10435 [Chthoniobacterales bacterium]
MKALFASLLCFVLTASQTFALKGGPPYPVGTNIIGSYAGVMQGVFDPTNPRSSNTLGIFSLGIPQTGLATGSVALFTGERTFVGTIQGIGDPNKATLRATLQAIPVVTGGGQTVTTLNFHADGTVNASIKTVRSAFNTVANTRLVGTASITTTNRNDSPPTQTISSFVVDGFKQSNTPPTGTGG